MIDDDLIRALGGRAPSELVPVELAVSRARTARRRPRDLRQQRQRDGFVQPSPLDLRTAAQLDALALASAPAHEALLLSPVAPLGVCSVLAATSQDRTLSAGRATEVVSDPTNVLAVECAERLAGGADRVSLCTVHQTLRAQPLPPGAGFPRHFRLFALVDAGRAEPEHGFERRVVVEHLQVFHRLVAACSAAGWDLRATTAVVAASEDEPVLADRLVEDIAAALPALDVRREPLANPAYYDGIRVQLGVAGPSGDEVLIGDVGRFGWLAELVADRKVRFVAGGFGLQLVDLLFVGSRG